MSAEPATKQRELCPSCGVQAVDRHRVLTHDPAPPIEALACHECGEWWFEVWGDRITTETVIRLGIAR
ncbi:MAG: hypothetical protein ACYDCC_14060 [Actinomycetota bacterium]